VIWLDAPAGVGLGATPLSEHEELSEARVAAQGYAFLQAWLRAHPRYRRSRFFVGGEGTSARFVTVLANRLLIEQQASSFVDPRQRSSRNSTGAVPINLAGVTMGAGLIDPQLQLGATARFAELYNTRVAREERREIPTSPSLLPPPPRTFDVAALRRAEAACLARIAACERKKSECSAAELYCWTALIQDPLHSIGRSGFDLRQPPLLEEQLARNGSAASPLAAAAAVAAGAVSDEEASELIAWLWAPQTERALNLKPLAATGGKHGLVAAKERGAFLAGVAAKKQGAGAWSPGASHRRCVRSKAVLGDWEADWLPHSLARRQHQAQAGGSSSSSKSADSSTASAAMSSTKRGLGTLLANGVSALVWAGEHDYVTNWLGLAQWAESQEWAGAGAFRVASNRTWHLLPASNATPVVGGAIRSIEASAAHGGLALGVVHGAGHVVARDRPEAFHRLLGAFLSNNVESLV